MKKKLGIIVSIVILVVCVLLLGGYIIYDKIIVNSDLKTEKQTDNLNDKNDEIYVNESNLTSSINKNLESYLIYNGENMVDYSKGIKVVWDRNYSDEKHKNVFSILVNNKKVYEENLSVAGLGSVYLIKDVLMYIIKNSDGTRYIRFIDIMGNNIKDLFHFAIDKNSSSNYLTINPWDSIIVEGNSVFISASQYMLNCSLIDPERHDELIVATYQINYLGNKQFSNIKEISKYLASDFCGNFENE